MSGLFVLYKGSVLSSEHGTQDTRPDLIRQFFTKSTVKKASKFAVVGGITTVTGLTELYVLVSVLGLWYIYGSIIVTFIGFIQNFVGNVLIGNIKL